MRIQNASCRGVRVLLPIKGEFKIGLALCQAHTSQGEGDDDSGSACVSRWA